MSLLRDKGILKVARDHALRNNADTIRYSRCRARRRPLLFDRLIISPARKLRREINSMLFLARLDLPSKPTGFRKSTFHIILHVRTLSLDNLKSPLMAISDTLKHTLLYNEKLMIQFEKSLFAGGDSG